MRGYFPKFAYIWQYDETNKYNYLIYLEST